MALGLERGDLFERTIEERPVGIEKGDVFLFYTDGLNEAENLHHEQFGEDRLIDLVKLYSDRSAESLVTKIRGVIERFTAQAQQHDDMTAVVVKMI